jgi:hypothetical protein
VPPRTIDEVAQHLLAAKVLLGLPSNGSNGVGHRDNHITVTRSYEVLKVLKKVEAELSNPTPTIRGVERDGLTVRYTSDPQPECELVTTVPSLLPQGRDVDMDVLRDE